MDLFPPPLPWVEEGNRSNDTLSWVEMAKAKVFWTSEEQEVEKAGSWRSSSSIACCLSSTKHWVSPAFDAGFETLWYHLLFLFTGRISQSQQSVFWWCFCPSVWGDVDSLTSYQLQCCNCLMQSVVMLLVSQMKHYELLTSHSNDLMKISRLFYCYSHKHQMLHKF